MSIFKLEAATKDYLWGGTRLVSEYGKKKAGDVTAESWELSCFPGSESVIANGEYAGKKITEYIDECGKDVLGTNCGKFADFPVLIKLIDAKNALSLQVHPSDEYALKNENQFGKTEMWYIVDADEGAFLYYGFNKDVTKEEFEKRIHDETLTEVLNKKYVKKGDVLFIEAGTLHAIGAGILIAEIQQNSNVTYRVYDYGRRDKNGNLRELHVEKALDVTKLSPVSENHDFGAHVATCKYFTVDKIVLDDTNDQFKKNVDNSSFAHILILEGEGKIKDNNEELEFVKGSSLFVPAGSGELELSGKCEAVITYIS